MPARTTAKTAADRQVIKDEATAEKAYVASKAVRRDQYFVKTDNKGGGYYVPCGDKKE